MTLEFLFVNCVAPQMKGPAPSVKNDTESTKVESVSPEVSKPELEVEEDADVNKEDEGWDNDDDDWGDIDVRAAEMSRSCRVMPHSVLIFLSLILVRQGIRGDTSVQLNTHLVF
jgi:hypothetical protein